ncbi:MAG: hypothetical protein C5B53_13145 [Candidatus Melainabacteria bacterium]|nr:MAG: hypothetical protein C5B53_13145 [Candidatus Melainabacteria bacterium]
MGALYVLIPCDWFPDSLAIGYLDDLGIVLLVVYFLKRIIPKVIFQDARRAAASTACGILCLNLFIPFQLTAKIEHGLFQGLPGRSVVRVFSKELAFVLARPASQGVTERGAEAKRAPVRDVRDQGLTQGTLQNYLLASCGNDSVSASGLSVASVLGGKQVFLLFRGGKGQVYSSNDHVRAAERPSFCKAKMPSFPSKGGIIVTYSHFQRVGLVTQC